jgi:hypothetical protein
MTSRIGGTLGAVLVVLGAPVAARTADTTVASTDRASEVSAYGGTRVWSQRVGDANRYVLMIQSGDTPPRRVPLKSAPEPLEPDLGRGKGSTPISAVIRRCDKRGDCDIHFVDLATGREKRVRGAATDVCREGGASVWGSSVAFVRRRFGSGRRCKSTDLVLRTKRGRARRVGGLGIADNTDLDGTWFAASSIVNGSTIFLVPRAEKRTVVVESTRTGPEGGGIVGSPALDGGFVYYNRVDYDIQEGKTQQSFRRRKAAIEPGSPEIVGTRLADSLSVDAGALFYTNSLGVFGLGS